MLRLNQNSGGYELSFFNMELNEIDTVCKESCNKDPAFTHELLHYLQDLNLPYNIRLNYTQWVKFNNLRTVARQNRQKKQPQFMIIPFNQWSEDAYAVSFQQECTLGSSKMVSDIHVLPEIKVTSTHMGPYYDARLKRNREFDVQRYTMNIQNEQYLLGAGQLMEYMAWKIETKHCPDGVDVPDFPYKLVDLLFEKYNWGFLPDYIKLNIVETCLYNDHPMHYLIHHYLNPQEDKDVDGGFFSIAGVPNVPNASPRLYKKAYKKVYEKNLKTIFQTTDGARETLAQKRHRRWTDLLELLDGQFQQFPDIRAWVEKVNQFAWSNWKNRFLFSDLYCMDTAQFQQEIWNMVEELGVPLIFNRNKELFSLGRAIPDNNEFLQFYILQEYQDELTSPERCSIRGRGDKVICPLSVQEVACGVLDKEGNILNQEAAGERTLLCSPDDSGSGFGGVDFETAVLCPYKRFLKRHGLENLKVSVQT